VHVPGTAAAGARAELAGEVRLGTGRERARFLVAHRHPGDVAPVVNCVGDAVERVADDAVDPLHAAAHQNLDHRLCDGAT
jgi:hypothetical protein